MIKTLLKIGGGVAVALALFGGYIGIDTWLQSKYVELTYHNACMAETASAMKMIQQDLQHDREKRALIDARDDVMDWMRLEHELELLLEGSPNNTRIQKKLDSVKKARERAEDKLKSLEQ